MIFSADIIPWIILSLLFLRFFYRCARLRSFPGPAIAGQTDLWRAYYMNYGDWSGVLRDVHKIYGPLVRLGPNLISVSDVNAIPIIYSMHGEFKKVSALRLARLESHTK